MNLDEFRQSFYKILKHLTKVSKHFQNISTFVTTLFRKILNKHEDTCIAKNR